MHLLSSNNPRARLIAIRAARGFETWAAFFRTNGIDDATANRWLGGLTVRTHFVDAFAHALGVQRSVLCALRDAIVEAERAEKRT